MREEADGGREGVQNVKNKSKSGAHCAASLSLRGNIKKKKIVAK